MIIEVFKCPGNIPGHFVFIPAHPALFIAFIFADITIFILLVFGMIHSGIAFIISPFSIISPLSSYFFSPPDALHFFTPNNQDFILNSDYLYFIKYF